MNHFLINYEHKARELEAACLIRAELENRGFSVDFSCTYDKDRNRLAQRRKGKVVLTSALYNENCLFDFVYSIAGLSRKVVNLQWEQVLTNQDEEDSNSYLTPKGLSVEAMHLCWGSAPSKRLIRAGVPPHKARIVGPVQMDLLRPEFSALYSSKKELAKRFNIDERKRWVLFISSFTYVGMTKEEYDLEVGCVGDHLHDFADLSVASKKGIVSWLETAFRAFPNFQFIYRPHPSENGDPFLLSLEENFPNFRVIPELSIKHWIKACEKILTWYSTSIGEIFFANKNCSILRPVKIPLNWDISVYRNANFITSLPQFIEDLPKEQGDFPIARNLIMDYYQVDSSNPAYHRVCDALIEVLHTQEFDMPALPFWEKWKVSLKRLKGRSFFVLKDTLASFPTGLNLLQHPTLKAKMEKHIALSDRLARDRGKNLASTLEIEESLAKIRRILDAQRKP